MIRSLSILAAEALGIQYYQFIPLPELQSDCALFRSRAPAQTVKQLRILQPKLFGPPDRPEVEFIWYMAIGDRAMGTIQRVDLTKYSDFPFDIYKRYLHLNDCKFIINSFTATSHTGCAASPCGRFFCFWTLSSTRQCMAWLLRRVLSDAFVPVRPLLLFDDRFACNSRLWIDVRFVDDRKFVFFTHSDDSLYVLNQALDVFDMSQTTCVECGWTRLENGGVLERVWKRFFHFPNSHDAACTPA